jgi:hypothetical protein
MFLKRYLRGAVLAMMFISAAATTCVSDSYDPDPFDDNPPVVTLEFHYLVRDRASVQVQYAFSGNRLIVLGSAAHRNRAHSSAAVAFVPQDLPELSSNTLLYPPVPLRC